MSHWKNTTSRRSRGSQKRWQWQKRDQWCHGGWQANSWDQRPARDWSDWTTVFANAAVTGVGNAAAVAGVGNAAAVAEPQLLQEAEPAKRGGKSHEVSFWKAWSHIARWREQEVDALKAALKQATFCHWRSVTGVYCTCCEQWLCDRYWYEEHKASKKHKKNSRSRGMYMLMSAAAWVDDETWSTSSEIGSEPYPEP